MMPKKFYITTAIDYVNSTPHIGTAYEKIAADAITRFFRMQGDRGAVFLQMGNDEHSVNVKKQADGLGLTPKVYCDQMRPKFEQTWAALGIQFDRFMQTSDKNHHRAVQHLFSLIEEKGYIYPGEYEGWYCESCEAFYTAKDLVDNLCPHHKTTPRWIKETNYFFKLSAFAAPLLAHIQNHPYFILPEIRRNEIVKLIEGGLQDISVSRSSFDWGVELPGHSGHVVYVWFDALINYLSGAGYPDESYKDFWPADLHIVGKDITRFHCVIWPAMLIAAELELPKTVFGHGFIALKGEKMSKSLGNVVGPLEIVEKYGADSLRYYLLREGSFGRDGNFTWENFVQRYNSDLANGLGNLVSRVLGMAHKYLAGQVEAVEIDPAWHQQVNRLSEIMAAMDFHVSKDFNFHLALEKIWSGIAVLDKFVDAEAPWRLAKENKMAEVNRVLYHCLEGLRVIAIELAPFLPQTAQKIWQALGLNGEVSQLKFADEIALQRYQKFFANQITGLFPRIVA